MRQQAQGAKTSPELRAIRQSGNHALRASDSFSEQIKVAVFG